MRAAEAEAAIAVQPYRQTQCCTVGARYDGRGGRSILKVWPTAKTNVLSKKK